MLCLDSQVTEKQEFFKSLKQPWTSTRIYNHFHNIFRLFDVLPNFPFTTSEAMRDYYLSTWYIRVASRINKQLKT